MIVFVATAQHLYTVASLCDRSFGPGLPEIRCLSYEQALGGGDLPNATYILVDIERLSSWERMLASELYRSLGAAGCRVLNDPVRVATRYRLLLLMHREGLNPFRAWRLEDFPFEPRFPVFLRHEADHGLPVSPLLQTPATLRAAVMALPAGGHSLAGLIAVEYCARPIAPGIWAKFGTFRIGETFSVDHAVIEDCWCVKHGTEGLATEAMFEWEAGLVTANRTAHPVTSAFGLAGIEYGRADHAVVDDREVVFEINTNPHLAPLTPQRLPIRNGTLATARRRFAEALHGLDGGDGRPMAIAPGSRAEIARVAGVGVMAYRP